MSWSSDLDIPRISARLRLVVLAIVGAALIGCGFHPLYGSRQNTEIDTDLSSITVALIPERIGQLLAISLRDGLNPSGTRVHGRYVLVVTVTTSKSDLAIRSDGTASRQAYAAAASFTLRESPARRSS